MAMQCGSVTRRTTAHGAHVPDELQEDLLVRLPAKSLLRFRAVCKAWKTLIDSNSFKKKHFQTAKDSLSTTLLFWRCMGDGRPMMHLLYPYCDFLQPSIALPVLAHGTLSFEGFGAVHSLVCLLYRAFLVIWNSSTKQSRIVENNRLSKLCWMGGEVVVDRPIYAFGFDPKAEDYKFMMADFTVHGEVGRAFVELYSLHSSSWRRFTLDLPFISISTYHTRRAGDGFLDGKFYWYVAMCFEKRGYLPPAIAVFNFSDEAFELIHLPEELFGAEDAVAVTTRGCLELITTFEDRRCEIWSLGGDGSWSRQLRIGVSPVVGIPRGIRKDGHLIFESEMTKEILLMNPTTGSIKNLRHGSQEFRVVTHVESLFSVN